MLQGKSLESYCQRMLNHLVSQAIHLLHMFSSIASHGASRNSTNILCHLHSRMCTHLFFKKILHFALNSNCGYFLKAIYLLVNWFGSFQARVQIFLSPLPPNPIQLLQTCVLFHPLRVAADILLASKFSVSIPSSGLRCHSRTSRRQRMLQSWRGARRKDSSITWMLWKRIAGECSSPCLLLSLSITLVIIRCLEKAGLPPELGENFTFTYVNFVWAVLKLKIPAADMQLRQRHHYVSGK